MSKQKRNQMERTNFETTGCPLTDAIHEIHWTLEEGLLAPTEATNQVVELINKYLDKNGFSF